MIIDKINIYNWKVTIFYESTCDDIDTIIEALDRIYCPKYFI